MIVVSDLMGTLTTGSPVIGMLNWVKQNQSKWQANRYKLAILPNLVLAKARLIDWQKWGQGLMVDSLSLVKNATPEKLSEVAEWIVETNLWKKRHEDVIQLLADHTNNGAKVYIASSVFEPAVEAFAKRIGAQAIGTPVKIVSGRIQLASELVADEKKIERVLAHIGADSVDYAYGDTVLDVPLLEHAEHPVAVYPDEKLRIIARERGWEIIGETASYP